MTIFIIQFFQSDLISMISTHFYFFFQIALCLKIESLQRTPNCKVIKRLNFKYNTDLGHVLKVLSQFSSVSNVF